jgi:hypothetical protein
MKKDAADHLREGGPEGVRARIDADIGKKTGNGRDHSAIDHALAVYDKWLALGDHTPIYATLGTIAANLLPGDPVWLGLVAPPSSARTRLGLTLERLLAGLDTLGVNRTTGLDVVEAIAKDSVPPLRRRAYEWLEAGGYAGAGTPDIATALDLPTNTVRRALEDLTAYGLVRREKIGKADTWFRREWEND